MNDIIQRNRLLLASNRQEADKTRRAFGLHLATPVETAPASWLQKREAVEQQHGTRYRKFFTGGNG